MSLLAATGTFSIGTGAPGTVVTVNGLAFQPKVVIFQWGGRTATGQAEGTHHFGAGYMVSATDRGSCTSQSADAAATSNTQANGSDTRCIQVVDEVAGSAAVSGDADFNSFNADGFSVKITDTFPANYLIGYIAIGGTDLTNVASVTVSEGLTIDPNPQDITTVGFQPDCVIAFGGCTTLDGTFGSTLKRDSDVAVGVAAGAGTPNNAVIYGFSPFNLTTMDTWSYARSQEIFVHNTPGSPPALAERGAITAWLSNGFRVTWALRNNNQTIWRALCLKGGKYFVGKSLTRTDTTPQGVTGVGFTPAALIIGSHNKAESTLGTEQAEEELSLSYVAGPASRVTTGIIDRDAVATSVVAVDQRTDEMYSNQSSATPPVVEGLMDLASFDSDGFTFVMNDADPSPAYFWFLAMGDTVSSVTVSRDANIPVEAFGGAASPVAAILKTAWEATGALVVGNLPLTIWGLLDKWFPYTTASGVSLNSPWEALARAASSLTTPWEALQGLAVNNAPPWEALQGLAAVVVTPWEAQRGLAALNVVPWEALQGLAVNNTPPWEAMQGRAAVVVVPWEALQSLTASVATPWESIQVIVVTQSVVTPWEALGRQNKATATPWEATTPTVTAGAGPGYSGYPWWKPFYTWDQVSRAMADVRKRFQSRVPEPRIELAEPVPQKRRRRRVRVVQAALSGAPTPAAIQQAYAEAVAQAKREERLIRQVSARYGYPNAEVEVVVSELWTEIAWTYATAAERRRFRDDDDLIVLLSLVRKR